MSRVPIDSQGLYSQSSTPIQIEINSSQIIPWSPRTTLEFHQKKSHGCVIKHIIASKEKYKNTYMLEYIMSFTKNRF